MKKAFTNYFFYRNDKVVRPEWIVDRYNTVFLYIMKNIYILYIYEKIVCYVCKVVFHLKLKKPIVCPLNR